MPTDARPLQREIAVLIRALVVFLAALIVALFILILTLLRMDRLAGVADTIRDIIQPISATASREDLEARLTLLQGENGIRRIEVYRGPTLFAVAGPEAPSSEVLTRAIPGGRLLVFFESSSWMGGTRNAIIIGAFATMATMMGLLILILYLPRFVRPLEEMLAQAQRISTPQRGDHDARYLVHTFREAVEKIQQQAQELDHLRDAATGRTPDIRELAGAMHRSFSSGFVAFDAAGNIVSLNEAGASILGMSGGTGETVADLPTEFGEIIRASLESRTGQTRREVRIESSGTLIGVTTVPLSEGEVFLGLFALFSDLTTYRAMEDRLRDFENLVALGQMSAGIAHEFRNSLFAILGYLRLAGRNASPETSQKITSAENEAKRLASAVDTLLNFARPLTIKTQPTALDELSADVADRVAAEATDVEFTRSLAAVTVPADRELLARALENIIRNAVDSVRSRHGDDGGKVHVEVGTEPRPHIVVRDNGVGLDPKDAARLLLPFQSGKPLGFGLGLPLAQKIVLHHGAVLTLGGAPGEGATVTIEFFRGSA